MPRLTVTLVRTALLELGIGFTIGALILFNKGIPFDPQIWRLRPAHVDIVLFGWTMQLAMGIAFWILPRFTKAPRYGREGFGWVAYLLLNTGLAVVVLNSWLSIDWLPFVGRALELSAVVTFALMMWKRVKPYAAP